MAEQIICEDRRKNQREVSDSRWEEECYAHGCRAARERAMERLKCIDEKQSQDAFTLMIKGSIAFCWMNT